MNARELFEAEEMTGYLDVRTLGSMLPDVNDAQAFASALSKLRLGQDNFTLPEKMQLAAAFTSLLREPGPQKLAALRKMMSIQSDQNPHQAAPRSPSVPPAPQTPQKMPS